MSLSVTTVKHTRKGTVGIGGPQKVFATGWPVLPWDLYGKKYLKCWVIRYIQCLQR